MNVDLGANMGIGTLIFGSIFYPTVNVITRRFLNIFKSLDNADIFLITEKIVCSVHAIVTSIVGLVIILNCSNDIMNDRHWLTNKFAWFGLPYFLYDLWAIYMTQFYANEKTLRALTTREKVTHFLKHNWDMMIHHLLLPAIFFPIIIFFRQNRGDYVVGIFYCSEIVIPFISIRFILAQLNMKESPIYIFFGLLMILVFFVTRILIFPLLYWIYGSYAGIRFMDVAFTIPGKCNIGCLIILTLQAYFMFLMIRGAFKVFYKMYKKRKQKLHKFSVD